MDENSPITSLKFRIMERPASVMPKVERYALENWRTFGVNQNSLPSLLTKLSVCRVKRKRRGTSAEICNFRNLRKRHTAWLATKRRKNIEPPLESGNKFGGAPPFVRKFFCHGSFFQGWGA